MDPQYDFTRDWARRPTLYPVRALWLRRLDALCQFVGVVAIVAGHGVRSSGVPTWEFGAVQMGCMVVITAAVCLRYRWSLAKPSFVKRHLTTVLAAGLWVLGLGIATIVGPALSTSQSLGVGEARWWSYVAVTEFVMIGYSITGIGRGLRRIAAGGISPAIVLVGSFLLLVTIGTAALMLPICRRQVPGEPLAGAPFLTALFTSTSASCVTGLIVEHTGTYWSRVGQIVILVLFQVGGLGIMTFGAMLAVIAGRGVSLTEVATLRDLFASDGWVDLRHLIGAILGFTFGAELLGACLMLGYWEGLPWEERVFQSLFHAVSAFCNAGFALTEDSFVGSCHRWEIACVIPLLIIVGGLGFGVLYNVANVATVECRRLLSPAPFNLPRARVRLRLATKLVLATTAALLFLGTVGIFVLERVSADASRISLVDAWFQSVTFRTAGFNTVDLGAFRPATKLLAILLMAIGASPISTGGGMKTTVFAVAVVALWSVIQGRDRVEAFGRTIPSLNLNRAMAILFVSMIAIMTTTMLLVILENRPSAFLDHMFEAASAVGTVGVSSTVLLDNGQAVSVTQSLTPSSRIVIIIAMFLGRVGPLTLLLALAGEGQAARYEYPLERVTLG